MRQRLWLLSAPQRMVNSETGPLARSWSKLLLRILLYSLLGLFFLSFNPFGIGDQTDQASQNALYKVLAPYYRSRAREDIVVVLINQASITELFDFGALEANEWPLRYSDHSSLLSRILPYQPRAVFVDIYFKHERSTDPSLGRFIRRLQRQSERHGVPLLFAAGYHDETRSSMQDKLGELGDLVLSGWEGYGTTYPLLDGGQETAAYRLYRYACLNEDSLPGCARPLAKKVMEGDAVSVLWGSTPAAPVFPEFSSEACAPFASSALEVGRQVLYGLVEGLVNYEGSGGPTDARCAYHPVISLDEVVHVGKAGSEDQQQRLEKLFRGKIVLYGLSLEGVRDEVESPVHGQLPGVFFHAMALDNLMYHGEGYIKAADEKVHRISQWLWLTLVAIFSGLLMYFEGRGLSFHSEKVRYAGRHQISMFVMLVVPTLLIAFISLVMFVGLRYEPLNSLGFIAMIAVSSALIRSEFAERLMLRFYNIWKSVKIRFFGRSR